MLAAGKEAVQDLTLAVGAVSTETTVTADAENGGNAQHGTVLVNGSAIHSGTAAERPGLRATGLLEPGVAPSRRTSDSGGAGNQAGDGRKPAEPGQLPARRQRYQRSNNNTPGSAAGVLLGVDTLREFRVLTNAYSAAYGRSAGGVISAITKSGTNELHGTLFEFVA